MTYGTPDFEAVPTGYEITLRRDGTGDFMVKAAVSDQGYPYTEQDRDDAFQEVVDHLSALSGWAIIGSGGSKHYTGAAVITPTE